MRFTATQKVIATSAAALGVVLGAAGITAAATNSGTTPAQQESSNDQGTGDFTPANEQGKPEPAEVAGDANDAAEGNDTAASEQADGPEAAEPGGADQHDTAGSEVDETPAGTTPAPAGQG
jgi:hypothetical protein